MWSSPGAISDTINGHSLAELELTQAAFRLLGNAIQCRVTTEDQSKGYKSDTGTLEESAVIKSICFGKYLQYIKAISILDSVSSFNF